MASISKIRYTNVVYENGGKRYNDEVFTCAGHNTAILLENGGGKTVFIQAALQAVLPHTDLGERKAKETFVLEGTAAHIAIEWIISERPRRYGVTAVTLYIQNNELKSHKYVYEYGVDDKETIEELPFTREEDGKMRAASRVEMQEYYQKMSKEHIAAKTFSTTKEYHRYIEEYFKIIPDEWRSITVINGGEGSVEAFFDGCKTTADLVEKLLLPTVEQGLVGQGSEAFAGTFESQREHFNKHKQLERSIKESEKIKTEIEGYVGKFETYNQKVKQYHYQKEQAKAIWNLIEQREAHTRKELQVLELEKKQVDLQKKNVQKELAWIEVEQIKEELSEINIEYTTTNSQHQQIKDKQEEKEAQRHLLKLSRFQHAMDEAKAKVRGYEEQLENLEEDAEVENLTEQLEENSGEIKGYYTQKLDALQKERTNIEREKERYLEEQEEQQKAKTQLDHTLQEVRGQASKLLGKLEHQQNQMNQLKMHLLAQGAIEDLALQEKKWYGRLEEIEDHKHKFNKQLREIELSQETLNQVISKNTEIRTQKLGALSIVMMKLEQLEEAHQKILKRIRQTLPVFDQLSSIYLKPQQVITALEEQVEKLTKEKEEALLLERRHAHFLENYENHDFFTVEPLLELWVEQWQSYFTYLQTGTAYVAGIESKQIKHKLYNQPSFAQCVVVADDGKEKLITLLKGQTSKLTYPVAVLTQTQASERVQQEEVEEALIYPSAWIENMQLELFEEHKKEVEKALDESVIYRKQKEKELKEMEQVLLGVSDFLKTHSHEHHAQLRESHDTLKKEETQSHRLIEEATQQLEQQQKEMKFVSETLRKEAEEKNKLQSALEKVSEYLKLRGLCEQEETRIKAIQETIQTEEKQLKSINYDLRNLSESLEEIREEYNRVKSSELRIKDDELYDEVKEEKAIYTNNDLVYLKDKRSHIKDRLYNKQKGRGEIEALLKHNQKVYEENERNLRQELREREVEISQIPVYRKEYTQEMEVLAEEIIALKKQAQILLQQVSILKTKFDKKEQEHQSKKELYHTNFGGMTQEPLTSGKDYAQMMTLQSELLEKEKYIYKQIAGLEKELKFILESKQQMDKKDELFGFCAPEVKAGVLEENLEQEFMYELKVRVIVNTLLDTLTQLKIDLEEGKKHIEESRTEFKLFCQREVRDSKLRNMAVQGITQKQNYESLVVWKENMVERINHTLTILERDLVDQDQQISQFIIHLYAYLKTVATELVEIPKNTRVNTEEGWKTIYEFVVPTWQEESGKEKIRHHIYGLLDDIEGNAFLDETGKEDVQKIKKYIKEQFKLRNLLKVVMGNDAIRIRCRKVSNISDISTQKYSWETSNKWSGGEKWSKNMALYLGILNYLAEKKQKIHQEEQKVRRAVILDNPFGKASSGHVLEPVFFIAKELGFQMIALTAHSEGDFIRRYFPIVYSCKLRSTMDQRTAIFSKEQEIKKAYFVDNDPVALSILGSNQMGLFTTY